MSTEYGDPAVALPNEILRTLVGSGVHGMAIEGTDDRDELGIFVEPPSLIFGMHEPMDQYVHRTADEGKPSGPGDTDLTVYSLRKYVRLAAAGNPTILLPLFTRDADVITTSYWGEALRASHGRIVSRVAGERFLGYLTQQRERMLGGGKRNRVPKRPELVERFGYDVKYASHALRLGYQGVELMRSGNLCLPMPSEPREACLAVKSGLVTFDDALALIDKQAERLRSVLNHPPLLGLARERPDYEYLDRWLQQAHLNYWQQNGLIR